MLKFHEDGIENISMAECFDKEMEDWRSKMIKMYGNQHPYMFYVTAGHDFEDMVLKIIDVDASERQSKKYEPFENLTKMTEIDKKAEEHFFQLLSILEKEKPTLELKEVLEQKKKECAKVFEIFDEIVSICEDYFQFEYSDCSKRVSKQLGFQEPVVNEVEQFLIRVEEFGNVELKSLHDKISQWVYNNGLSMLDSIDQSYSVLSDQPFAMTVWYDCATALTSKEIRCAFLTDQKEMCHLWKKAFDDLLMLSAKLEKCRCNYNLMKFKLEREIFWMSRDYKENMPELTKMQRHLANLVDKKVALKSLLKNLQKEIKEEQKRIIHAQNKMHQKIIITKANNKFALEASVKKFHQVLNTKKEEVHDFLSKVLKGDQYIHEEILGVPWNPVDLSQLKCDNESETNKLDNEYEKKKLSPSAQTKCSIAVKDDFSKAFHILKTDDYFVTLLNTLADEMGYMLDFKWVNYVKEKLELFQEVKWLELFKVFKINFVEELGELKEHMMSYCKFNDDGKVVFDIDGAVDGFLNFVWKKRQSNSDDILPSLEYDLNECKMFCSSVTSLIPKSLLWENVEEVLLQYWDLLETRSNLLNRKFSLLLENQELENYLINYHKYGASTL